METKQLQTPPAEARENIMGTMAINAALGRETCVKMILDAAAAKEKTLG